MAELFDALVSSQPSNRAAFSAFISVKSASARTELLQAAFEKACPRDDPARSEIAYLVEAFGKFGARRNELAHGRVYDLGEHGFMLGPNNVMPHKWTKDGEARYQYAAKDVEYYAACFQTLSLESDGMTRALVERASKTVRRTRSRHDDRDR